MTSFLHCSGDVWDCDPNKVQRVILPGKCFKNKFLSPAFAIPLNPLGKTNNQKKLNSDIELVGGLNPSEQIASFPQIGMKIKKYLKFETNTQKSNGFWGRKVSVYFSPSSLEKNLPEVQVDQKGGLHLNLDSIWIPWELQCNSKGPVVTS